MTELRDAHRDCQPRHQRQRQLETVVLVELQFRQQVGARDAEERARAKRERASQPGRTRLRPRPGSEIEQQRPQRSDQGERQIDQVSSGPGRARRRHQGGDRQRAEGLVQMARQ